MSHPESDTVRVRESFRRAGFLEKAALLFGTWFGVGMLPAAPGTWGTLAGLPLIMVPNFLGRLYGSLFLLLFISLAAWSAELSQRLLGCDDPSAVVIDEVAGLLLSLFLLPLSWPLVFGGFLFFRLFDIWKPFPIGFLEQRIRGGVGIVLDDLLAGLLTNAVLRFLLLIAGGEGSPG